MTSVECSASGSSAASRETAEYQPEFRRAVAQRVVRGEALFGFVDTAFLAARGARGGEGEGEARDDHSARSQGGGGGGRKKKSAKRLAALVAGDGERDGLWRPEEPVAVKVEEGPRAKVGKLRPAKRASRGDEWVPQSTQERAGGSALQVLRCARSGCEAVRVRREEWEG
jgi:hypothetical protein